MNTAHIIFLFSLGLLLLTGLNFFYSFLPLPGFVAGMVFGTSLAVAVGKGWQLMRAS